MVVNWKDGDLNIFCITMLCICYWFHFTCDIEYHNMIDFKQTRWNEVIMAQNPFQQFL